MILVREKKERIQSARELFILLSFVHHLLILGIMTEHLIRLTLNTSIASALENEYFFLQIMGRSCWVGNKLTTYLIALSIINMLVDLHETLPK